METKKAVNQISGRTDLAVELQEDIKDSGSVDGIRIITKVHPNKQMKETHIVIENEEGERKFGKPIGNYITIESDQLCGQGPEGASGAGGFLRFRPCHLHRGRGDPEEEQR